MGTRVHEGWGGNRVYYGTNWMELYHTLELELYGDVDVQLTWNEKIPNNNYSVLGRLIVDAVFDDNTLDNGNTFTLGGGVWPSFSGSVSIPTVSERQVYNQTALLYPAFGSQSSFRVTASLSSIDRVPGTTSFDKYLPIPARAWATPNTPTVVEAKVVDNTAYLDVSGHQNNPAADRYWQTQDKTIYDYATDQWTETHGLPGNLAYHSWPVVENNSYRLGVRTWNEDGDVSAWTPWARIYTKPTAPTGLTAVRRSGDRTTVDLSWNNTAAYVGSTRIFRRSGGSWVEVGSVAGTGTTWSETRSLGSYPEYRVVTQVPDGSVQSNPTATAAPVEYLQPAAPTGVTLTMLGEQKARVTFGGNQTNPAVDQYWANVYWDLQIGSDAWVYQTYSPSGDTTSFDSDWNGGQLPLNSRFQARVRAWNSGGFGPYGTSGYCYTTPLTPTNVVANRVADSAQVQVTWDDASAYAGSYLVQRSTNGGAWADVGTSTSKSFADTLEMTSYAQYRVVTRTPAPVKVSAVSAASNTVPTTAFEKDRIPGIDQIYAGTDKVFRVMAGDQQIWLG